MSESHQALVERALSRLGHASAPETNYAGLLGLYLAWCRNVPFDNVRKRIALAKKSAEPLPGGRAADFLAAWLEHGTGGTCWPSSNGLHALLVACGFDVRRISASMFDLDDHNHGSLIVRLEDRELLVDSSIENEIPIPLERGVEQTLGDAVHPIRVEPVGDSFRIHWGKVQNTGTLPCRLMRDPVDQDFYLERYEISRGYSPFNTALYARKNFPGRLVSFVGCTRHEKTTHGVTSRELSPAEVRASLVGEFGFSAAIVQELEQTAGFG
jgi:arylamine N-acetyltransferase